MDDHPYMMYSLVDQQIYETIEKRKPNPSFHDVVKNLLPAHWKLSIGGVWTNISQPGVDTPRFGWKIHLSCIRDQGKLTLERAVPCLVEHGVDFKFLSDNYILDLSLNKNWPRSQVGKFITAYPRDKAQCQQVATLLAGLTADLSGPYILTDMPVDNSQVVHVRHGAFLQDFRIDRYGVRQHGFHDDQGQWQTDERRPATDMNHTTWSQDQPSTPTRHSQARSDDPAGSEEHAVVIGGRYAIHKAFRYNGEGGIYHGIDTATEQKIVLREIRRGINPRLGGKVMPEGYSIQKEARLMQMAQHTGLIPAYVDHFQEDGHWFLVQQRLLDTKTLWGHAMDIYFALPPVTGRHLTLTLLPLFTKLARGLQKIHGCGVILRDLTRTNVLVTPEGNPCFIDLEFAHGIDEDSPWIHGWTPGFASPQQRGDQSPSTSDDCYAFGVLLLDVLTFCATGMELHKPAIMQRLRRNLADLDMPAALYPLIDGLINADPATRLDLDQAIASLEQMLQEHAAEPENNRCVIPTGPGACVIRDAQDCSGRLQQVLEGVDRFLSTSMTASRRDRLWPSSPMIWSTNPVCLAHGASGVALYLQQRGQLSADVLAWIRQNTVPANCPPGFYHGLAGIAYMQSSCADASTAAHTLEQAWPARTDCGHSLFFGLAGIGLACLQLHSSGTDGPWLDRAVECARLLQAQAEQDTDGVFWRQADQINLGLAEGQTGVALFLLYLHLATGDHAWLAYGKRALDFDLSRRIDSHGHLLWHLHDGASPSEPKTPHLWAGTAGIGSVVARYHYICPDPFYSAILDHCSTTLSSRFGNKTWLAEGFSGIIEFHIDMAHLFPADGKRHLGYARHLAVALLDHAIEIEREDFSGTAFAGVEHVRLCADLSHGTAGIALTLHRLQHGGRRQLMLDQLLPATCAATAASGMELADAL